MRPLAQRWSRTLPKPRPLCTPSRSNSFWISLVNANGVAVRVENHRHAANTGLDRFDPEFHAFRPQVLDGLVKVLDFEGGGAAIGTRFEGRRGTDSQSIGAKFVFGPLAVFAIIDRRGFQSKHAFVETAGARHVGDRVTTKGEFDDVEHNATGC